MKKALSILAIMFVTFALFAAAGTTVKIGGAYDNFKTTIPKGGDFYDHKVFTTGDGFGVEGDVQYDMPQNTTFFIDFNIVFFQDAKIQRDLPGAPQVSVKDFYGPFSAYEKNQFFFNFFSYSFGVAKRFDVNNFKFYVGGGFAFDRLWLKSTATEGLEFGTSKVEYTVVDKTIGITAYLEAKVMLSKVFGISLTAKPQVGIYNKHTTNETVTYTSASAQKSVTKKLVKDFAISHAMPVSVTLAFSF